MLYNGSDIIRDVEWVIFDEVHYVNDTEVSNKDSTNRYTCIGVCGYVSIPPSLAMPYTLCK